MKLKKLNEQLLRLPSDVEITLCLIKEDLKSNRLLNNLTSIGFDDTYHRPGFGKLILATLGFEDLPDELFEFYYNRLDKYTKKIGDDNRKLVKAAFNLYVDLIIEKRKGSDSYGTVTG